MMKKRLDQVLIVGFFVLLGLPASVQLLTSLITKEKRILEGENRAAMSFPIWQEKSSFTSYTKEIESWMVDNMGLRSSFLDVYGGLRDAIGLSTNGQVVVGQDGWLFLNHGDMVEEYQGLTHITDKEIEGIAEALESILCTQSISFFLIPPNKQVLYGAYLPPYIKRSEGRTRRDHLQAVLQARGVPIVDPLPEMLDERDNSKRLYHKTDTHWTDEGAYLAYSLFIDRLRDQGVTVSKVERTRLKQVVRASDFRGDLTGLLGSDLYKEEKAALSIRQPVRSRAEKISIEGRPETTWPLVLQQELPGAPTLTVSADSFIEAMLPYLKESFSRIVVLRREPNIFYMQDIEDNPSDVFMIEMVERLLYLPVELEHEKTPDP